MKENDLNKISKCSPKAQEKKRFRVSEIDELRRKLIPVFNMSKRRKKRKDDVDTFF